MNGEHDERNVPMTDDLDPSGARILAAARDDARTELDPSKLAEPMDWNRVEANLFDRVRAESAPIDRDSARWNRVYSFVGVGLAAAVLLAIGLGPKETPSVFGAAHSRVNEASVTAAFRREGAGELLVNGLAAANPATLSPGTIFETRGARAIFPFVSGVSWTAEDGTKLAVEKAEPLVVSLERGAVEAQVTPVTYGEAYAVDIDSVRVAVHGTHLRVARSNAGTGDKVTIDLSEGVIAVGAKPQRGSTVGTSIAAPAHVEFDVKDPVGTMRIEHTLGSVRTPYALSREAPTGATPALAEMHLEPKVAPAAPAKRDEAATVKHPSPSAAVVRNPKEFALAQVNRCWGESISNDGLKVVVESSLEVRVNKSHVADLVRFDPPLPPAIQECVSSAVLRGVYGRAETVFIPIKLSR